MIDVKEILKKHNIDIVNIPNYESLEDILFLTKKKPTIKNFEVAISEIITEVLQEAADSAKIQGNSYTKKGKNIDTYEPIISDSYQTSHTNLDGESKLHIETFVNKNSIMSVINKVKL